MKVKVLLIVGIAILVLLSGCTMPAGSIDGILPTGLGAYSETEFVQECGARGGEVCGADEVCRGSVIWSVGSVLGQFSCCNMTCGEMTADDECRSGADCDDGDSSTADRCSGTPMKCSHIERICDGPVCTFVPPSIVDSCADVTCPTNQKCIPLCAEDECNGECVPINVENLCADVTCPTGQECIRICDGGECDMGCLPIRG